MTSAIPSPFSDPSVPSVLPRGPHRLDRKTVMASQRGRILMAFVEEVAEHGYGAVTVAGVVGRAGTAKRTFYEHFDGKQDCFIQAFMEGASHVVGSIIGAGDQVEDPYERIVVGVRAYIDGLVEIPAFAKLYLNGPITDGPDLAEDWVNWFELLAAGLVEWRETSRQTHPEVPPLTQSHAIAAISAINGLARVIMHRDGIEGLRDQTDEIVDIALAFFTVRPGTAGRSSDD